MAFTEISRNGGKQLPFKNKLSFCELFDKLAPHCWEELILTSDQNDPNCF